MRNLMDEFSLVVGISLGALIRDKERNNEAIRLLLEMPTVKKIARDEPHRILGSIYRQMGVSYEETSNETETNPAPADDFVRHG